MAILTPPGTLAFPALFKPKPRDKKNPASEMIYSCALLFSPEQQKDAYFKAMKQELHKAIVEKFGADANVKKLKLPFKTAEDIEGFDESWIIVNMSSKQAPSVVDRAKQAIIESPSELGKKVWGGQIVRAYINPYAWSHETGGRGASFGLNAIQVLEADRPRMDNRVDAKDAFNDGQYADAAPAGSSGGGDDDDLPF